MSTQVDIPGYVAGTWAIDPARSTVSFEVRQMGISTVRGRFDEVEGTILTTEHPWHSSVSAVIRAASINTGNRRRDRHLQTAGFLAAEQHPTIAFASTGLRPDGDAVLIDGDLTIRGVTKRVTLSTDVGGFDAGDDGRPRVRLSARSALDRDGYGVVRGPAAAVISKKVTVLLAIEATRQD